MANDRDGKRQGKCLDEVEARRCVDAGEEPVGDLADPWFEIGDHFGAECLGDEPAQTGVVWRVQGEQVSGGEPGAGIVWRVDGRFVPALVDGRGAEPLVAEHLGRNGVTRRRPDAERAAEKGAAAAEIGPQPVGVELGLGSQQPGDRIATPLVDAKYRRFEDPALHLLPSRCLPCVRDSRCTLLQRCVGVV
ncbi:MAG: hypothetical protein ACYCXN_04965 [Acidimicrobiales bacterium]